MSTPDPADIFRIEAAELLEQMEQGLLDLEHRLDDRNLVDAVFRALHTLKGSGAMFGFDRLAAFTHHCETAFDRVRKGLAEATPELVSAVLDARDHMRALVEDPTSENTDEENYLLERLQAAVSEAGPAPVLPSVASPAVAESGVPTTWRIRFGLPENTLVNGTNPLSFLDELRAMGECRVVLDRSALPPLEKLDPTALYVTWDVTLTTSKSRADIEDVFLFVMDDMTLDIEELGDSETRPNAAAPAAVIAEPPPMTAVTEPKAERQAPDTSAKPVSDAADPKLRRKVESVRVPAERLDELMDRVGELVIVQSRLQQIAAGSSDIGLRTVSEEMERLCSELRVTMMVLRMVPVATLFDRYRRLVHDLQRDTGKKIELSTDGESTEMDKTVIERLADPLVHLVRNAADHGLEPIEARLAAGKPEAGSIRLSARQTGGEVIISVTDDGRGIDRAKVRAKAEAAGLIQAGATIPDQELLQLIFQPGFSTASSVTNLSGRGVGMDVVKKAIESLHGSIDVASRPGEGSTVSLRIPLTLAIIDGLLVRVGEGHYVIPLPAVEECIEISQEEDLRSRGRAFLSLRDTLVPFIRLRELFATGTKPDRYQKMVVVSTGEERVGLIVDQIIGHHQTVIKSMSKLHDDVTTFSGATILGDGSVALILDVINLVSLGQEQEARLRAIA
ncbi:chemotaxis protein CheA [Pleomorphomonas diazotrophica]|uniref:Chemotaxis protein CheA n=1 Tax=Pleomorphomonas diazotrophica TaxID=1166257 RepID=A0A1I4WK00_9HYPH|nr:chemotaxis protein CheA [Pleomorphomonas diazotrophica]PKR89068.1 chemotaxis protein CheA [Pleomorphomonas diazotrophica]SFN13573.1 two-component system, chemotaxis family, sensor kinase CheA [Pleomorphomonas diazotrophica]